MRAEPVSKTSFSAVLRDLMNTHDITTTDVASRCKCSVHSIHYLLGGGSAVLRITRSVIEAFGLEENPKMLRRIFIGYLLQKFPAEWLVIAGLVRKE